MQVISLFSGIGGFELAAEWAGWDNVVSCEIDPFCNKVLNHYWPDSYHHTDVKTLTYEIIKEKSRWQPNEPTIIVGGFPCQPFSAAGKRKGTDDPRHLWPEMCRIIREVAPEWVVGENVRGLVNWSDGLVFEQVCADLEAMSYEVQPFILPAAGVGAPHRRDRVWFVAHAVKNGNRLQGQGRMDVDWKLLDKRKGSKKADGFSNNGKNVLTPDPGLFRPEERQIGIGYWNNFPTQPPVRSGNDGLSPELVGITVSKHRNESIKAYGNAIVPQVFYQIACAINEYNAR